MVTRNKHRKIDWVIDRFVIISAKLGSLHKMKGKIWLERKSVNEVLFTKRIFTLP